MLGRVGFNWQTQTLVVVGEQRNLYKTTQADRKNTSKSESANACSPPFVKNNSPCLSTERAGQREHGVIYSV